MIFVVWFWFSKAILAERNVGRAIKEIRTFRLAITDGQCYIVICGCGMNKRYVVWVTNWGKTINLIKRDYQLFISPLPFVVWICLFHICSIEVPIRISLNYDIHINFFLKEVLYLLNEIYICRGPCNWIGTSPYT